jgi:hypothetical protein
MADNMSEDAKRAAMVAFRVSQAAGIVQVTINTIVAASKAMAELGPIAGAISAAAIGVSGAAQVAAIAGQSPPKFHAGGILAPDELYAPRPVITRNEIGGVLTSRGTAALGGPAGVASANRGESPSGPQVVQLRFRHRILDEVLVDYARRRTPLNSQRTSVRGHRSGV